MRTVDLYFDYVSPFAYLLNEQLHRLPDDVQVNQVPVLFAGLLKHWGQLGPVEVDRKRLFTYRHTTWLAERLGIDFRFPNPHPFNPLPYLRLTVALGNNPEAIKKIYRIIWTGDCDPTSTECWDVICNALGVAKANTLISDKQVKAALKNNTDSAIALGVFGVPTVAADGELFWGLDSMEMLNDYLADRSLFSRGGMERLEHIRDGVAR